MNNPFRRKEREPIDDEIDEQRAAHETALLDSADALEAAGAALTRAGADAERAVRALKSYRAADDAR